MDTGIRIKARRNELELTQDQLGEKCGATKSAVSQWESNTTQPSVENLLLLRDALDCSIDWLLTGQSPPGCGESVRLQRLAAIFSDLDARGQDAVFRVAEAESAYSVKADPSTKRAG